MSAGTLVTEAERYLEAVDLFRSLELDVTWRSEAYELSAPRAAETRHELKCDSSANSRVGING
jgi:hypothetical protein